MSVGLTGEGQHVTEVCFSSNCTNSLWNREDDHCVCKTCGACCKECGFPNVSCKHKVGYTTIGRWTLRTNTSDSSCWHTCSRFLHQEVRDNERRCHRVTTKFIVGDTKSVSCVHVSSICTKNQKRRSVILIHSTH